MSWAWDSFPSPLGPHHGRPAFSGRSSWVGVGFAPGCEIRFNLKDLPSSLPVTLALWSTSGWVGWYGRMGASFSSVFFVMMYVSFWLWTWIYFLSYPFGRVSSLPCRGRVEDHGVYACVKIALETSNFLETLFSLYPFRVQDGLYHGPLPLL